jgi:glycine cleavage system H protein
LNIHGYEFPDDLYYDANHAWARVQGDIVSQGFTDLAQRLAKAVTFVELPRAGRQVQQGKPLMSVESNKWVGRVYALASGQVVLANEQLTRDPGLVNRSPYEQGWMAQIRAADLQELKNLMRVDDPAFAELVKTAIDRYKL